MQIILADPQTLVRAALRHYLDSLRDTRVLAEAQSGAELLEQVAALQPEVAVCEFLLPDISGFDLAHKLRRHFPRVGLVFLSSSTDSSHVRAALRAGACAYLTKCSEPQELELALRAHEKGQVYVSASVSRTLLEGRRGQRGEGSKVLSRRQREVLRMVGRGKSTKEIAQLMALSPKTVETHRARLMQVLGLRGISALTHFAVRHGPHSND